MEDVALLLPVSKDPSRSLVVLSTCGWDDSAAIGSVESRPPSQFEHHCFDHHLGINHTRGL